MKMSKICIYFIACVLALAVSAAGADYDHIGHELQPISGHVYIALMQIDDNTVDFNTVSHVNNDTQLNVLFGGKFFSIVADANSSSGRTVDFPGAAHIGNTSLVVYDNATGKVLQMANLDFGLLDNETRSEMGENVCWSEGQRNCGATKCIILEQGTGGFWDGVKQWFDKPQCRN